MKRCVDLVCGAQPRMIRTQTQRGWLTSFKKEKGRVRTLRRRGAAREKKVEEEIYDEVK